jgi:hypothetical protein
MNWFRNFKTLRESCEHVPDTIQARFVIDTRKHLFGQQCVFPRCFFLSKTHISELWHFCSEHGFYKRLG